jgi:hypothetical protein
MNRRNVAKVLNRLLTEKKPGRGVMQNSMIFFAMVQGLSIAETVQIIETMMGLSKDYTKLKCLGNNGNAATSLPDIQTIADIEKRCGMISVNRRTTGTRNRRALGSSWTAKVCTRSFIQRTKRG